MRRSLTRTLALTSLAALAACASRIPPDRVFPVFFTDYSARLDAPAQAVVAHAADVAKQFPHAAVTVEGYADDPANPARSHRFSIERANAVAALLIADGVDPARIKRSAQGTPPGSVPGVASRRVEIDVDVP